MKLLSSKLLLTAAFVGCLTTFTQAQDDKSQQTLEIAQSFLQAAGMGDMETLEKLMAEDFVWHNEGDKEIPWIGNWEGKEVVLKEFLPAFGAGLKTTSWTTDYSFAKDDQAVFLGTMSADAINTGSNTGTFTWAVRVHVVEGKVKSWNWLEDSYAVSRAYHGN
ncbi:MAG: nuclear transport factor 2 family protein [Bacteroidota bacterium]